MSAKIAGNGNGRLSVNSFTTRKCDAASEYLHSAFGDSMKIEAQGKPEDFAMRMTGAQFGAIRLVRCAVRNWDFTRSLNGVVIVKFPTHGSSLQCLSGTRRHEVFPARGAGVGHPFDDFNMKRSQGAGLALDAPIDRLIEVAEQLTNSSYGRALASRMASTLDLSSPASAAFARSLHSAMAEIGHLNSHGLGELALAGHEEIILNFAVASLFPEVVAKLGQVQPDCGPTVIHKARDYIHAHAAEAIELSRLARQLGVSMRAMQENFQKYFGFSPRDFLMRCRLERARRSLLSGEQGSTVTRVALASGFGDVSHFSAKYRCEFGETPSKTLRHARRQLS